MPEVYTFPIVLFRGRMNKIQAHAVADKNICVMKDNVRMAYFMARHEIYHHVRQSKFDFERHKIDSLFSIDLQPGQIACWIDVDMMDYAKKTRRFKRRSGLFSTLTFSKKQSYDLIAKYKHHYIYPAILTRLNGSMQIRFVDIPEICVVRKTEAAAFLCAREALYQYVRYKRRRKESLRTPSVPFGIAVPENSLVTLIDMDRKEYKHKMQKGS